MIPSTQSLLLLFLGTEDQWGSPDAFAVIHLPFLAIPVLEVYPQGSPLCLRNSRAGPSCNIIRAGLEQAGLPGRCLLSTHPGHLSPTSLCPGGACPRCPGGTNLSEA